MTKTDWDLVLSQMDDNLVQRAVSAGGRRPGAAPGKRVSRTLLLAAAVAAALTVAALAVVAFGIHADPVRTGEGLSGTWNGCSVSYDDARLCLTFDVEGECRTAEFRAGWLPSEPSPAWDRRDADGWTSYLADDGAGAELPYTINIYSGNTLRGVRCTLNGAAEVARRDEWNGYQRLELRTDYSAVEGHLWDEANYVLLFQPDGNYLVYIAGTSELSVLEKIAENLEVRPGAADTRPDEADGGTDVCWFDLGRG